MKQRALSHICFSEKFGRQMRLIAGPRQSGKTSLAKIFLKKHHADQLYYNWDQRIIRDTYYKNPYFFQSDVFNSRRRDSKYWVCFDELHKLPKWKNYLKDVFDRFESDITFVVTGSAKLDIFRKSGDSLAGRYFLFHLFPMSLQELAQKGAFTWKKIPSAKSIITACFDSEKRYQKELDSLIKYSGFPEPLTKQSSVFHTRWKRDYIDRIIREDLRDLTKIASLDNIAKCLLLLPERIGSPLSVNSLVRDIEVNYQSVKNYLSAMEMSYLIFRISPYASHIARSIKKEQKCYLMDWTRITNPGIRFENVMAVQIWTWVHRLNDAGLGDFELKYVRTREGKETDFLILKESKPWMLIEIKLSRTHIDTHHTKMAAQLGDIPFIQLVHEDGIAEKPTPNTFQLSASRFFPYLP